MSDLVTGEAVPLEMRLAKMPSRAVAILIDLIILGIAAYILFSFAGGPIAALDPAAAAAIAVATLVLLVIGVPTTIETLSRGRSVGKLVLGLRVVRDDGGPVRFRHALLRALAGFFADFFPTSGAGAIICSLLNERGKRIGDWLAGTVVVRERVPSAHAPLPAVPPELAQWATTLELSRLPDDLAMAARNYLARGGQLAPRVRDQMGAQLANEVSRVVTPPPPHGVPPWAYLAAVLTERGRRESARIASERTGRPDESPGQDVGRPSGQGDRAEAGTRTAPGGPVQDRPPDRPEGRNFAPPA